MSSPIDEKALIERAKEDKEAFGQLYELYVDRIYNYVYYRTGNVADAEDLTAKIFVRAMKHIPRYKDQGVPFSAWLYRIAHNLVANWHRDHSRRQIVALDDITHWHVGDESPEFATQLMEDKTLLLSAIRRLPSDRQELLILKFVERLSNAEIGDIMGRSEGAIKSLYHRTLLSLREDLHGRNGSSPPSPAPSRSVLFRRPFSRKR
ncbi:MAG: sigma-70 family RNA polymerase sigma factor [Ardenticatenaceae bacterium]|nr:sigma-70 family RNA polymerase sigma factor [Anaerolineales bacterium]MCB9009727.1 sigma-70 family RNA polymerase sigma factor [Ardenticatenaceae bacterium]